MIGNAAGNLLDKRRRHQKAKMAIVQGSSEFLKDSFCGRFFFLSLQKAGKFFLKTLLKLNIHGWMRVKTIHEKENVLILMR